jgi:hypothetical protein
MKNYITTPDLITKRVVIFTNGVMNLVEDPIMDQLPENFSSDLLDNLGFIFFSGPIGLCGVVHTLLKDQQ